MVRPVLLWRGHDEMEVGYCSGVYNEGCREQRYCNGISGTTVELWRVMMEWGSRQCAMTE